MRILLSACAGILFTAAALPLPAQEPIYSGPQKGEALLPFEVIDLTSGIGESTTDYISQFGDAPTLVCFIHHPTRAPAGFLQQLDETARRRSSLRALFVLLLDDITDTEKLGGLTAAALARKVLNIRGPVGVSVDGSEGPGSYGLNSEATLTILLARSRIVTENWALVSVDDSALGTIRSTLDRVAGTNLETVAEEPADSKGSGADNGSSDLATLLERFRREFPAEYPKIKALADEDPESALTFLRRRFGAGDSKSSSRKGTRGGKTSKEPESARDSKEQEPGSLESRIAALEEEVSEIRALLERLLRGTKK